MMEENKVDCGVVTHTTTIYCYFCHCCIVFGQKSGSSWSVKHLSTTIIDDVTMVALIADFPSVSDHTNATMSC
jgi:hypothetical protein